MPLLRMTLLLAFITCLSSVWLLEQPSSSLMIRHERFQWLIERLEELNMRALRMSNSISTLVGSTWFLASVGAGSKVLGWIFVCYATSPTKMFRQRFWMRAFKHPTAKPTITWSNTSYIVLLDKGSMTRKQLTSKTKTSIKMKPKNGRARYQGSPALKGTQSLVLSQQCI